jgi:hypothetical protein
MSAFLTTVITLLTLSIVVSTAGYLLALLAAITFDAAAGRLALPGPARVHAARPAHSRHQRRRGAIWRTAQAGGRLSGAA